MGMPRLAPKMCIRDSGHTSLFPHRRNRGEQWRPQCFCALQSGWPATTHMACLLYTSQGYRCRGYRQVLRRRQGHQEEGSGSDGHQTQILLLGDLAAGGELGDSRGSGSLEMCIRDRPYALWPAILIEEHKSIVDAIVRHDCDGAEKAMYDHCLLYTSWAPIWAFPCRY